MLTPPTFRSVARMLGELPHDLEARAHARFRALGGDGQRWQKRDVIAMADALTRIEDVCEAGRPRVDRAPIRDVRRALEGAADGSTARRAA